MSNTVAQSGGIGLSGALAVLFIGLKLTNLIAWSWIWVLSPLWIPFALFVAFFLAVITVAGIAAIFKV